MHPTVSRTLALARRLGVELDGAPLARLVGAHPWKLAEWSINAAEDPRGRLRLTLWTDAGATAVIPRLPPGGIDGLGVALRSGDTTRRWYREGAPGFGEALYNAVTQAIPALSEPATALVRAAGHPLHFGAVGLELGGGLRRASAYVCPPDRAALERMLSVAGLSGLEREFPRGCFDGPSWPRVYVARSVGDAGGWKLYYGARNHLDRVRDEALLACARVEDPREDLGAAGRVQVLGLAVREDGARAWTAYFAER